jgi:hypothetical protein
VGDGSSFVVSRCGAGVLAWVREITTGMGGRLLDPGRIGGIEFTPCFPAAGLLALSGSRLRAVRVSDC